MWSTYLLPRNEQTDLTLTLFLPESASRLEIGVLCLDIVDGKSDSTSSAGVRPAIAVHNKWAA